MAHHDAHRHGVGVVFTVVPNMDVTICPGAQLASRMQSELRRRGFPRTPSLSRFECITSETLWEFLGFRITTIRPLEMTKITESGRPHRELAEGVKAEQHNALLPTDESNFVDYDLDQLVELLVDDVEGRNPLDEKHKRQILRHVERSFLNAGMHPSDILRVLKKIDEYGIDVPDDIDLGQFELEPFTNYNEIDVKGLAGLLDWLEANDIEIPDSETLGDIITTRDITEETDADGLLSVCSNDTLMDALKMSEERCQDFFTSAVGIEYQIRAMELGIINPEDVVRPLLDDLRRSHDVRDANDLRQVLGSTADVPESLKEEIEYALREFDDFYDTGEFNDMRRRRRRRRRA